MTPAYEENLARLSAAVAIPPPELGTPGTLSIEYLEGVLADTETVLNTITTIKQELRRTVNALPLEVLVSVFWFAVLNDEPKRKGDGWRGSPGWMSILWVCQWWRYIMFENCEIMGWVYSVHPALYKLTGSLAGTELLRIDSGHFFGVAKKELDEFLEYTDFYRAERVALRNNISAAGLLRPLATKPWTNLRILEIDQRLAQRDPSTEELVLVTYQLHTLRLTDYWLPVVSQDLKHLSVHFTDRSAVRLTMVEILEYLTTTSFAVRPETLELTNAIEGSTVIPADYPHIALQALQYLRIHNTAANAIQLLTTIDWDGNAMLALRALFSVNAASDITRLAETIAGLPILSLRIFWQARKGGAQRLLLRGWTPYMRSQAYAESRVGEPPAVYIDLHFPELAVHWLDVAVLFARKWSSPGLYLHDISLDIPKSVRRKIPCTSIGNAVDELQYVEGIFPNKDMLRTLVNCNVADHDHSGHIETLSRLTQAVEVPGFAM